VRLCLRAQKRMNSGEYRLAVIICQKKRTTRESVVHHYAISDSGRKREEGLQWRVLSRRAPCHCCCSEVSHSRQKSHILIDSRGLSKRWLEERVKSTRPSSLRVSRHQGGSRNFKGSRVHRGFTFPVANTPRKSLHFQTQQSRTTPDLSDHREPVKVSVRRISRKGSQNLTGSRCKRDQRIETSKAT
jgi:hypothetical protein